MEPGVWQILIVVAIIILFFGAKKIPQLAKGVGEGISEFKKATSNHIEEGDKQETPSSHENTKKEKPKQETKVE
jgi:sec-independent protein translocase protein TatA